MSLAPNWLIIFNQSELTRVFPIFQIDNDFGELYPNATTYLCQKWDISASILREREIIDIKDQSLRQMLTDNAESKLLNHFLGFIKPNNP